ncbi:MAG: type II secretion system major pseudopilin GspG [Kiloniellaceae bacterium]
MPYDRTDVLARHRRLQAARRRRQQAGMTLLELLVVITVLGLLTAAVGTVALNYLGRAKTETTQLRIDQVSAGLDLFRLDMGRYPTEAEGLRALVEAPANAEKWQGPYLKKAEAIEDAWGSPFLYASPGQHGEVDIFSLGADKADGGEGENRDVTSW